MPSVTLPNVTLMGTGGPRLDARRATSLLVRSGEEEVMIDTGRGAIHGLAQAGADFRNLTRVLITHHHFDHIGDLYDVILTTWIEGRREPLLIQGPPGTKRIVDALLTQIYDRDLNWRSLGEPAHGGWSPVIAEDIGLGEPVTGKGWQAVAHEMSHGHGLPTLPAAFLKQWICYGYRFTLGDKVFAFSGDTVDCPGLRSLAQGADVLVLCCWTAGSLLVSDHLKKLARHTLACGDTVGKIAQECGVQHLVLTHLRPNATEDMLETLRAEVAADFGGRLTIATDGLGVQIG